MRGLAATPFLSLALIAISPAADAAAFSAPLASPATATVVVDYSSGVETFGPYVFGTIAAPYFDPAGYALAQTAGFKLIEVWCSIPVPFDPNDPSQYDFSGLDQQVSAVIGAGAEPLIVFAPGSKPSDLNRYATYAQNVAKHLTQGWGNGHAWNVKAFRFANEPDNPAFWRGTQQEFFDTYAAWARALKAVNPAFVLDAPGLMGVRGTSGPNGLSTWVTNFLAYCQANGVPVDLFSFHAYSPVPYFAFYDNFRRVGAELQRYPNLSPLYGTPRLANDEWNIMVGDLWSGSYHSQFDTAWVAAHNIDVLINMVEQGLQLSIRYGGTFNGGSGGCHDFPLTDCSGQGKPAFYAFEGFNWLARTARLSSSGTDHVNFAATAGKGVDQVVVVLSNYDVKTYLDTFEPASSPAWSEYNAYVASFGTPAVYGQFSLELRNLPWDPSQQVGYERYLVDDQNALALMETQMVAGNSTLSFAGNMSAPSVQVIRLAHCVDSDGDGYGLPGDRVCPAGPLEDCNDADSAIHPGAPELCDAVDNDCDGIVDNVASPAGSPSLAVAMSAGDAVLEWTPMAGATAYDLVQGDLHTLGSTAGDFTAATMACVADDLGATSLTAAGAPSPGEGFWYLVRGVNCGGGGTYDSGAPSQAGLRDAEVNASASSCP